MAIQIEGIEMEVASTAKTAADGIKALATSLSKLETATSTDKMKDLANGINKLAPALKPLEVFRKQTSEVNKTIEATSSSISVLTHSISSMQRSVNMDSIAKLTHGFLSLNESIRLLDQLSIDNEQLEKLKQLADALAKIGTAAKDLKGRGSLVPTAVTKAVEKGNVANNSEVVQKAKKVAPGALVASTSAKAAMSELTEETEKAETALDKLKKKLSQITAPLQKLSRSIGRIAFYRAVRGAIKSITGSISEGIGNMYQYSKLMGGTFATNMDTVATKSLTVRNAFGSVAASLINAVMPAFVKITNAIITATNWVSRFLAILGGKSTYSKAVDSMTEYAESAGGAAEAVKSLTAGIDELNVLSSESSSGGGASGTNYSDMFKEESVGDVSSWTNNLSLTIKDVLFNWEDLTAESITEKLLTGLCALTGWELGGPLGLIAGIALGMVLNSSIFDNDGKLEQSELEDVLNGTSIGGLLFGFGIGGAKGGLMGATLGVTLGLLLEELLPEQVGTMSKDEFTDVLNLAVAALGGATAGFKFLGFEGALMGAALGVSLDLLFKKIDPQSETKIERSNLTLALLDAASAISGLLFFMKVTGGSSTAGLIGASLGLSLALLFQDLPTTATGKIDGGALKDTLTEAAALSLGAGILVFALTGSAQAGVLAATLSLPLTIKFSELIFDEENVKEIDSVFEEIENAKYGIDVEFNAKYNIGGGYASGGYPSTGELFMAREAGPELVGTIGGRTAVMNNSQIVESVSSGVYNAVVSAMRGNSGNQNVNVYLDGKQIEASTRTTRQRRGATIATGGALNYS